jgi:hypothetical protein
MFYNFVCFGSPFSLSYESYVARGADSEFKGMQQGFMGLTHPRLETFAEITIHPYRGLFYLDSMGLSRPEVLRHSKKLMTWTPAKGRILILLPELEVEVPSFLNGFLRESQSLLADAPDA